MAGCPVVVAYRLGPATAAIARRLIRTRYITLFNVAAQDFVAPERVQEACTGEILARDISALLGDRQKRDRQIADQFAALRIMRGGIDDPIDAAAAAVIEALTQKTAATAPVI
jgi:lipid-A-disaccharide synthase